jgi:hypothetical protein
MNNEVILGAYNAVCNMGFTAPAKLAELISSLNTPMYRVTVVGKYQVGKTTLINNIFLGGNAIKLHEGEGLCTTAIPTELVYGETSKLEVYHWADEAKSTEQLARTIANPNTCEVEGLTVKRDQISLAQKISRVKLYANNASLKQYTVLDTPGIDDPDADLLMNTTYRLIPESDLALVVVEDKQLDSRVMDLLRKNLFNDGISHLMVLVSYNPTHRKSAAMRKEILETITAQVKTISDKIPVEMYCYDESCSDILCSVDEIASTIQSFLSNNALAGKQSRVVAHLRRFLENCSLEIATRIKAASQNPTQNAAMSDELAQKRAQLRRECDKLTAEMAGDLETVKTNAQGVIRTNISNVFSDFIADLRKLSNIDEFKERLEQSNDILKPKLSDAICKSTQYIEKQVDKVLEAHNDKYQAVVMGWNTWMNDKLEIEGGFMTKIPKLAYIAIDVILINILLPGGWIIALLGKWLQSSTLKSFTTQNLALMLVRPKVQEQMDAARDKYINEVNDQLNGNIDKMLEEIRKKLDAHFDEQMAIVQKNLSNAPATDSADVAKLKANAAEINKLLASLTE